MLENGNGLPDSTTPSSKRVYAREVSGSDGSSSSKKLCVVPLDLEKSISENAELKCFRGCGGGGFQRSHYPN